MKKGAFMFALILAVMFGGLNATGLAESIAPRVEPNIDILGTAASELGIDTNQLKDELQKGGNSLYTLLNNAGKLESFKSKLLEQMKAEIDVKVQNGSVSREKADKLLDGMKKRLDSWNGQSKQKIRPAGDAKFCVKLNVIGIAAKELGQSERHLKDELKAGKSIYTLLNNAGRLDSFKISLLEGFEYELSMLVDRGDMRKAKAEQLIRKLTEELDQWKPDNDIFSEYGKTVFE